MPAISVNLGEVHESKPVPDGVYDVTISEAEYIEEKNQIMVTLGIDDHLDAPNIRHYISLPNDEDDERKTSFKNLMLKRFLVAFGLFASADEIDTDEWPGAQCSIQVTLTEPNDAGNIYNRLVLPYLPDEDTAKPKSAGKSGVKTAAPPKRGK